MASLIDAHAPHILVINHSPDILELLQDLLIEEGYRVSLRTHLDRDLSEIAQLAADLIVIDYMWPEEDDNWSLLQLLRLDRALHAIPIVLCTGAVREATALAAHLLEMHIDVVFKPFNIDQLLKVVAAALDRDLERDEANVP